MFNFIVFSWALTVGFVPQQQNIVNASMVQIDKSRIATESSLEFGAILYEKMHIYTEIETFQYLSQETIGFNPYRSDYTFGADFFLTDHVTLGLSHECDHAVTSGINLSKNEYLTEYKYGSTETKIFVRIGSEKNR